MCVVHFLYIHCSSERKYWTVYTAVSLDSSYSFLDLEFLQFAGRENKWKKETQCVLKYKMPHHNPCYLVPIDSSLPLLSAHDDFYVKQLPLWLLLTTWRLLLPSQ